MILTRTFTVSVSYDPDALDTYIVGIPQDGHGGVIADEIKSNLEDLEFVSTVAVSFTVIDGEVTR